MAEQGLQKVNYGIPLTGDGEQKCAGAAGNG